MELFLIDDKGLYQSPAIDDYLWLPAVGVDTIVDLEGGLDPDPPSAVGLYIYWPIVDGPLPELDDLMSIAALISQRLDQGHKTLVHCGAGINRASLMNGCVLHWQGVLTGKEIVKQICDRRPGALSNPYFRVYLETLP